MRFFSNITSSSVQFQLRFSFTFCSNREKQDLSRRLDRLNKSHEDHLADCEERTKHLELAREKFEKLHRLAASGNANLKHQHEKERARRKEAEAKLLKYSNSGVGQSAKKVDKGKKRMIYQDDEEEVDRTKVQEQDEEDDFEVPMASTSMSRSRVSKDYDISAEDSLQIDNFPHSRRMDLQDGYEQDNFDDLDHVHPFNITSGESSKRSSTPNKKAATIPDWFSQVNDGQKENISKKRARDDDDGIAVIIPNRSKMVKGKGKEKEKPKSQEWMNQVLTQSNKTIALGEKKRSKYFHK